MKNTVHAPKYILFIFNILCNDDSYHWIKAVGFLEGQNYENGFFYHFNFFFFFFFLLFRATSVAYRGSQARGPTRAVVASLHHRHSKEGSKRGLQPTPQLTSTLAPSPTELGHGSNPPPHGYKSGALPPSHNRNPSNF